MRKLLLFIAIALLPGFLHGQTGKVYDELSMASKILDGDRKFAAYFPPDYGTSERSYPVLYLLHGGGDDQTGWVQFGEVLHLADEAINKGEATPMIIIMPDANTGKRGYANDIKNQWRYEDFFFQEFMPFIENQYRIKKDKRYRAIAGLSMGGDGTFTYALHHPELFSAACPLSAATGPLTMAALKAGIEKNGPRDVTEAEMESYFKRQSVLALIEAMPDNAKKAVRWYIDCGDDDFLYEGNSLVHIAMRKKEIPHEFRIRDGGHNWTYWRASLPTVLSFVSASFHQY